MGQFLFICGSGCCTTWCLILHALVHFYIPSPIMHCCSPCILQKNGPCCYPASAAANTGKCHLSDIEGKDRESTRCDTSRLIFFEAQCGVQSPRQSHTWQENSFATETGEERQTQLAYHSVRLLDGFQFATLSSCLQCACRHFFPFYLLNLRVCLHLGHQGN